MPKPMQQLTLHEAITSTTPDPLERDFERVVEVNDSTVIHRIAYSPKQRKLRVWFHNRTTWEYAEVWPGDFAALVSSYSVGQVFNDRIRDRFDAVRISEVVDRHVPPKKAGVHEHHGAGAD